MRLQYTIQPTKLKIMSEPKNKAKNKEQLIHRIENEEHSETKENCSCPKCGSSNVYGISRVVGYFSVIDNWNKSKQAELKRRQKGNYWSKELKE